MTKIRLVSMVALGLGIINVVLIAFIFFGHPNRPRPEGPRRIIIEKLHLDRGQVAIYDSLIAIHRQEVQQGEMYIGQLKNKLYASLAEDSSAVHSDSLIQQIGKAQINMEETHFRHFQALKNICHADQLVAFNKLSHQLADLFSKKPHTQKKK